MAKLHIFANGRPWSDGAFCGILSGFAQFAKYPVVRSQENKRLLKQALIVINL